MKKKVYVQPCAAIFQTKMPKTSLLASTVTGMGISDKETDIQMAPSRHGSQWDMEEW